MCPRREGHPCGDGSGEARGAGRGRGLLEPAVLTVLARGATHGYDLRGSVEELTAGAVVVDPGGLYRVLRRMEADGRVTSSWTEGEHGPQRRTYAITEAGRDELSAWACWLQQRRRVMDGLLDALGALGVDTEKEQ